MRIDIESQCSRNTQMQCDIGYQVMESRQLRRANETRSMQLAEKNKICIHLKFLELSRRGKKREEARRK